jgi:hypothetical protein
VFECVSRCLKMFESVDMSFGFQLCLKMFEMLEDVQGCLKTS